MFNKYYVFVPAALEHNATHENTDLTVNELDRRRLVAEAQANLGACQTLKSDETNFKKCA